VIAPEDVIALTTASTMSLFYREQPFKHTVMRCALCDTLQPAPLNTVKLRYADMPLFALSGGVRYQRFGHARRLGKIGAFPSFPVACAKIRQAGRLLTASVRFPAESGGPHSVGTGSV
jgi:hypothetical protein